MEKLNLDVLNKDYEDKKPIQWQTITAKGRDRVWASILDLSFYFINCLPLFMWAYLIEDNKPSSDVIRITLIFSILVQFYIQFIIPLLTKGKTIGKLIMGIRIISDQGKRASVSNLFMRSLFYTAIPLMGYIPIVGIFINVFMLIIWFISLLFIYKDPYHQAIHDKVAFTYVVYDGKYKYLIDKYNLDIE